MKIIKRSEVIESVEYHLCFDYIEQRNSGFRFPCDSAGIVAHLNPSAAANYRLCLNNEAGAFQAPYVQRFEHAYRQPAIGLCPCGAEVDLGDFTNTCECGYDYNWAGQRLAPREQWGDETGETAADIP